MASAWLTVVVLMWWCRKLFGPLAAVIAGFVLATSFGFLYVHSGRSGNPDALFALLILLAAVSLWRARRNHWQRVWFGLIAAAVFLLKGTAVLMPLAFGARWDRAELFVIRHALRAEHALAVGADDFMALSAPGDYFLFVHEVSHPQLTLMRTCGRHRLYRRLEAPAAPSAPADRPGRTFAS